MVWHWGHSGQLTTVHCYTPLHKQAHSYNAELSMFPADNLWASMISCGTTDFKKFSGPTSGEQVREALLHSAE